MTSPGREIRLRSSARSDRGRVRQNNEDNVHLWSDDGCVLAVVADGMGGAVAGEEASRIAIETIQHQLKNGHYRKPDDYRSIHSNDLAEMLGDAVRQANLNIIHRARGMPELKGMGTTITLAFARQDDVILAHVGDSRAYLIEDDGHIRQITVDHSFVQALVDAGHITPDEAEGHPMSNVLYRALGQAEDLDVDVTQGVQLHMGDRMVLCSDGLTLHVRAEEIAGVAISSDDPNIIADKLVELANSRGGKDNISVVVIVVAQEDDSDKLIFMDETSADEEITVPMNPDYNNITRTSPEKRPHFPTASYGEGRDTFEPFQ